MAAKISGVLTSPNNTPMRDVTILLTASRTSLNVLETAAAQDTTDAEGRYSFESVPAGTYDVTLLYRGAPRQEVGRINIYADTIGGTLNQLLDAPEEPTEPDWLSKVQSAIDAANAAEESAKRAESFADDVIAGVDESKLHAANAAASAQNSLASSEASSLSAKNALNSQSASEAAASASASSASVSSASAQESKVAQSSAEDAALSASNDADLAKQYLDEFSKHGAYTKPESDKKYAEKDHKHPYVPISTGWGTEEAFTVADANSNPILWNGGKMGLFRFMSTTANKPNDEHGTGVLTRYMHGDTSGAWLEYKTHSGVQYNRFWNGAKWFMWEPVSTATDVALSAGHAFNTALDLNAILQRKGFQQVNGAYDLNDATLAGAYTLSGNYLNSHVGAASAVVTGQMIVHRRLFEAGPAVHQELILSGVSYVRQGTSTEDKRTWTKWAKVYTSENKPSLKDIQSNQLTQNGEQETLEDVIRNLARDIAVIKLFMGIEQN